MYNTLYDVSATSGVDWQNLFVGLCFVLIGVAYLVTNVREAPVDRPRWFPMAFLCFSIMWTLVAVGFPYYNNMTHASALRNGQANVIEGLVQDFHTRKDCKGESFMIGGQGFEYSYYEDLGRFHFPQPCGGPIKPGLYVRITYVGDDDIVKLEERKTGGSEALQITK